MAKKFVRTITDTKLTGKNLEPLITNKQNDLLSDNHDVYVRNKDYYHCLTNGIQKVESKNKYIVVTKKNKNTVVLEYTGDGGGGGESPEIPLVKLESLSKYIDIKKVEENYFQLSTEKLEIELEEIREMIKNLPTPQEGDFLGDFNDYDFKPITDNTFTIEKKVNSYGNVVITWEKEIGLYKSRIEGLFPGTDKIDLSFNKDSYFEETAKKNLVVEFINSYDTDYPLTIDKNFAGTIEQLGIPRFENEINYTDGDITIKGKSTTKIKLTFYTDPTKKVIRIYIKEID